MILWISLVSQSNARNTVLLAYIHFQQDVFFTHHYIRELWFRWWVGLWISERLCGSWLFQKFGLWSILLSARNINTIYQLIEEFLTIRLAFDWPRENVSSFDSFISRELASYIKGKSNVIFGLSVIFSSFPSEFYSQIVQTKPWRETSHHEGVYCCVPFWSKNNNEFNPNSW